MAAIVVAALHRKRRRLWLISWNINISLIGFKSMKYVWSRNRGTRCAAIPPLSDQRSDLNAARISSAKSSGCSQAAK